MRIVWMVLVALCTATLSMAQPIHGSKTVLINPQKDVYHTSDEWVSVSSQCHWLAPAVNTTPGIPAHTHNDLKFPMFMEWSSGTITVPFTLTLYHTAGRISQIDGRFLTGYTLDNGLTLSQLVGDPEGLTVYTGTATFDPQRGITAGTAPLHGWFPLYLEVFTTYTNGDRVQNSLRVPIYSMVDPSKPEAPAGDGTGIRTQSACAVIDHSAPPGFSGWGKQTTETLQLLPILGPISPRMPWLIQGTGYNYSIPQGPNASLPPGAFETRIDPDFHHGNDGTLTDSVAGVYTAVRNSVLPTILPDGTHKMMLRWRRPTFDGAKELDSILVVLVTAGLGGVSQPPNNIPLMAVTPGGVVLPPPPPPPPLVPGPCAGLIGQTQDVTFASTPPVQFHVTITGSLTGPCVAAAIPF